IVINLAIDDGCIGLSASLNSSTVELCGSTMKACLASVPMPICEGGNTSVLAASVLAAGLGAVVVARGLAGGGFCGVCRLGAGSACCATASSEGPARAAAATST